MLVEMSLTVMIKLTTGNNFHFHLLTLFLFFFIKCSLYKTPEGRNKMSKKPT